MCFAYVSGLSSIFTNDVTLDWITRQSKGTGFTSSIYSDGNWNNACLKTNCHKISVIIFKNKTWAHKHIGVPRNRLFWLVLLEEHACIKRSFATERLL